MRGFCFCLFILFLLNASRISSQSEEIPFHGVIPSWDHVLLDSFDRDDLRFFYYTSLVNDDHIIHLLGDDTEARDGYYVSSRHLDNGNLIWEQYYGLASEGIKETPSQMYIEANDELVITSFKDLGISNATTYNRKSIPVIRYFNLSDGQLIDAFDSNACDTLSALYSVSNIYAGSDGFNFLFVNGFLGAYVYDIARYDQDLECLGRDTMILERVYNSAGFEQPTRFEDGYVNFRFSSGQTAQPPLVDSLLSLYDANLDFFDLDFTTVSSVNVSDYLPYYWSSIMRIVGDNIAVICEDSIGINGVDPRRAIVYFDQEGSWLKTVDFGNMHLDNYQICSIDDNRNIYITPHYIEEDSIWETQIYIDDDQGNWISLLPIKHDRNTILPRDIRVVNDDELVITYLEVLLNEEVNSYLARDLRTVKIDLEDLGFIPSTAENVNLPEVLSISPNPSNDYINLSSKKPLTGQLELRDIRGKLVRSVSLKSDYNYKMDIQDLEVQTYVLSFRSSDGMFYSQKVAVQ